MDRDKAIKANELIKEIDELKTYKKMGQGFHFECVEHYSNNADKIVIDRKYCPKFIKVLDNIINELEQELLNL